MIPKIASAKLFAMKADESYPVADEAYPVRVAFIYIKKFAKPKNAKQNSNTSSTEAISKTKFTKSLKWRNENE